ncbi:MAG: hypothetical protein QY331_14450 [Melioribacteraceae bacterium]|nr:MAG: hypothetical protein QY331_14450 [Melioribacteraceae bacterium]
MQKQNLSDSINMPVMVTGAIITTFIMPPLAPFVWIAVAVCAVIKLFNL